MPRATFVLVPLMNIVVCVLMCVSFILSVLWYIPFKRVHYHQCYRLAER